jgi:hypothetical protein
MYMSFEESGLIQGSVEQKNQDRDRIWEYIRQLKGEKHEKENHIGITGAVDVVTADPVELAG